MRRRPSGGERPTRDREYRVRALERDACDERAGLGERERGDAFRHEDLPLERDNRGTDATEPNARSSPASSERSVREFGSTYTRFRGVEVGFDRVPAREDNVVVDVRRVESTLVSTEPRVDAAEQAEVSTDREVGRTDTKEDRKDVAEVDADRAERATDRAVVRTDRREVAKDRAAHGADRSEVATDRSEGATDRGSHRPGLSVLEKERSVDETDRSEVATDRSSGRAGRRVDATDRSEGATESWLERADRAEVATDRFEVATDCSPVRGESVAGVKVSSGVTAMTRSGAVTAGASGVPLQRKKRKT